MRSRRRSPIDAAPVALALPAQIPEAALPRVGAVALALSLVAHGAVVLFLPHHKAPATVAQPIFMQVIAPSKPDGPVVPQPSRTQAPAAAASQHALPRARQPVRHRPMAPSTSPAPKPTSAPTTPAAPVAAVHIGVSLSSTTETTQGPSEADGQGDTAGSRSATKNSNTVGEGATPGDFVPSDELTRPPEVDAEPDLRTYYPDAQRLSNVEGQVVLLLRIDITGRVIHADIQRSDGKAFDDAARRAAIERLHFRPAQKSGHNVATQIIYKMTFLLD